MRACVGVWEGGGLGRMGGWFGSCGWVGGW